MQPSLLNFTVTNGVQSKCDGRTTRQSDLRPPIQTAPARLNSS
jgi:hypothetical protein